jgi:hypothetical protein
MEQLGLSVWPVDSLSRVFPDDSPTKAAGWDLAAARDEYCTFQLGLRYEGPLRDMELTPSSLRCGKAEISHEAIQVRWVDVVPVGPQSTFSSAGAERPEPFPGWYPDPLLDSLQWDDYAPRRATAGHLTLRIPADAAPGHYRGKITVRAQGKKRAELALSLQVWPFAMPRPTFHVTNWLHLDCVTMWHRCQAWSPRHWQLLELYARDMAEHRLNVISTPTLFGNFHNFDRMTLVDVTRRRDGGYRFDMSRLDRWVKLFDRHGFELFEMWHFASQAHGRLAPGFGLYDEAKGKRVWYDQLSTNSPVYRKLTGDFLRELSAWLEKRGLSDRFLLHVFDEPEKEAWGHYAKLSSFFRRCAPQLRHLDAISTSELITQSGADIDIPVPLTEHLDGDEYYEARACAGREPVWWYTCCGPSAPYANRFVSMPLINTRLLHWQAYLYGISGYLHWGFNFWHRTWQGPTGFNYADEVLANPYREAQARWSVGDACIVYPHPRWWEDRGPVGSLRYEAMREGLQDDALLRLLDSLLKEPAAGPGRRAAVARGKRLLGRVKRDIAPDLTHFTRDAELLLGTRRDLGECVAKLI